MSVTKNFVPYGCLVQEKAHLIRLITMALGNYSLNLQGGEAN